MGVGEEETFRQFLREIVGDVTANRALIRVAPEGKGYRLPTISTSHYAYEGWDEVNEFLDTIEVREN